MRQIGIRQAACVIILLALPLASYGQDEACPETALPATKAELLEPHAAVFSGEVVKIQHAHVDDVIVFEVGRSWKGVEAERVVVRRSFALGFKSVDFEEGETYLVFASAKGKGEELRLDSCSRTKKVADAEPELKLLEEQPSHAT